jgi:hypothetical protein
MKRLAGCGLNYVTTETAEKKIRLDVQNSNDIIVGYGGR